MKKRVTPSRVICALAVITLAAPEVSAGSIWKSAHEQKADCPPSQYSCLHYLTPNLYRVYEQCHGPKVGLVAPDRYPQFPLHYEITTFPCPTAPPNSIPRRLSN
jgi:hypothetical protein